MAKAKEKDRSSNPADRDHDSSSKKFRRLQDEQDNCDKDVQIKDKDNDQENHDDDHDDRESLVFSDDYGDEFESEHEYSSGEDHDGPDADVGVYVDVVDTDEKMMVTDSNDIKGNDESDRKNRKKEKKKKKNKKKSEKSKDNKKRMEADERSDDDDSSNGQSDDDDDDDDAQLQVYRPDLLQGDELDVSQLVCDTSAYDVLCSMSVEWPFLSIDACIDTYNTNQATNASIFPMKLFAVGGTQADLSNKNKVVMMKISNVHKIKTRKKKKSLYDNDDDSDDDDSSNSSEEDDKELTDPVLEHQEFKHTGAVNRIRSLPQKSEIISTWSDSGRVYLFNATPAVESLTRDQMRMTLPGTALPSSIKPFYTFTGHKCEGYAMDWSKTKAGHLLTGGINGQIFLWEPRDQLSGFDVNLQHYRGHKDSVEDIQWSPSELNVFASCSMDRSIRFWDTRNCKKQALSIPDSHDSDVNVISWNGIDTHLLVSGGDDGAIKVWDLRMLQGGGSEDSGGGVTPAAELKHHRKPITSIRWHLTESSVLAASSADHSISIWDLAVERDPDEEAKYGNVISGVEDISSQLMFLHMGQKNIKEICWHPQLPSILLSTAEDGINVFRPRDVI